MRLVGVALLAKLVAPPPGDVALIQWDPRKICEWQKD